MNIYTDWLHGTPSIIEQWTLIGRGKLKGATPLHKALFFTTSRQFAVGSGIVPGKSTNVYQANILPGAKVLDLSEPGVTCTEQDSENLRHLVVARRPGQGNIQCEYKFYWENGWITGQIMKYATRPGDKRMEMLGHLAMNSRHTHDGMLAWNICQAATRECIEDIVDASIEAEYQAIAGNEVQDGVTYPILIVLDPTILTPPVKV